MAQGEPWMFHSHIGLYLNAGLLTPDEIVQAVEAEYHAGRAPLNAVEALFVKLLGGVNTYEACIGLRCQDMKKRTFSTRHEPYQIFIGQQTPT